MLTRWNVCVWQEEKETLNSLLSHMPSKFMADLQPLAADQLGPLSATDATKEQEERGLTWLLQLSSSVWKGVDPEGAIDQIVRQPEACDLFWRWLDRTSSMDLAQLELLQSAATLDPIDDLPEHSLRRKRALQLCTHCVDDAARCRCEERTPTAAPPPPPPPVQPLPRSSLLALARMLL